MAKEFVEHRDYYVEKGRVIFTEHYLKERGECCGNDCRHCPYSPRAVKNNTELKK
jgi:hypothetical protein